MGATHATPRPRCVYQALILGLTCRCKPEHSQCCLPNQRYTLLCKYHDPPFHCSLSLCHASSCALKLLLLAGISEQRSAFGESVRSCSGLKREASCGQAAVLSPQMWALSGCDQTRAPTSCNSTAPASCARGSSAG